MDKGTRIDYLDFIKGVLIVFVVWGHFCMHLSGEGYEKNLLTTYIRLFQMPLFILISGYFQKPITDLSLAVRKVIKSVHHIGVPLICWILIVYGIKLILNCGSYCGIKFFLDQAHGIVSLFWYLGCLFVCIMIYTLLSISYNCNKVIGFVVLLAYLVIFSVSNISIFYLSFLWVFFMIGVVFNKVNIYKYITKKTIERFLLLLLMFISLIVGWTYKTSWTFYNTDNCLLTADSGWSSEYVFFIYRYFVYMSNTFLAYVILKRIYNVISNSRFSKMIIALGKETLFIYVAHVTILSLFLKPILEMIQGSDVVLEDYPLVRFYWVSVLCTIVMVIVLYYLALYIKRHMPYISKFLLGN